MATTTASNGTGKSGAPASHPQSNGSAPSPKKQPVLAVQYPVNSVWEFTLESANNEKLTGRVYTTDEASQIVVLQKALVHTTLACGMDMINVASIVDAKALPDDESSHAVAPLSQPLAKIQKKALEEREKRAVRLAEESFKHINQKASPEGQAVFDRLLKACAVVVWKEESIVVLNQIQVDPPYKHDNCKILQRKGSNPLESGSLDRVKKIVNAAPSSSSTTSP